MTSPRSAEVRVERLDLDLDPSDVIRRLRGRDRLVALLGAWHHGEALIAVEPTRLLDSFDDVGTVPIEAPGSFGGGWIGAWGYQLAGQVERLPPGGPRPVPQPDLRVGWYDLVLRRSNGVWTLESLGTPDPARRERLLADLAAPAGVGGFEVGPFSMTPTPDQHRAAVARALDHITAGDIFQVNLCTRLEADFRGDPVELFCAGVAALRPAYAALVTSPEGAIVSFSPELFLRRVGAEVLTSPIKGTAPLSADPAELVASAKDRAENVMIVDLMRNDVGRVAQPGSVRVPALTRLERHAVWHLVSDVVAHLDPAVDDGDLLRATFPPGSVTGAPKVRAMEIIADLEATGREAYTGAIGHISPAAGLELNVAIRTFEVAGDKVWLGVGGGIVADSDPHAELVECLVKAEPLVRAIGSTIAEQVETAPRAPASGVSRPSRADESMGVFTTLLVTDGVPQDLDAHLARLDASVRAVHSTTVRAGLEQAVRQRAAGLAGRQRLRVEAAPVDGDVRVRLSSAELGAEPVPWRLVPRIVPGGHGAHKWVDRRRLASEHELLILDVDGSVLETSRANLFAVLDDGLHTPALDGRILPGTMRARVIERATAAGLPVFQRRLTTADLAAATEVFATNALRGVVPVGSIDGVGQWAPGPVTALLAGDDVDASGLAAARSSIERPRVLFVDNYDSFVFNLVQYVRELGAVAEVVRNDEIRADEVNDFSHLVLSPGPGSPADAGVCAELVRRLGPTVPTLGVCLGHQVIGEVYGARVVRADRVVHGKPSLVHHGGDGVFAGLPSPVVCARYHSLVVVDPPEELEVTARTGSGTIMGIRHRVHPVEGVQMHPESILTSRGHDMLATFLQRTITPSA